MSEPRVGAERIGTDLAGQKRILNPAFGKKNVSLQCEIAAVYGKQQCVPAAIARLGRADNSTVFIKLHTL